MQSKSFYNDNNFITTGTSFTTETAELHLHINIDDWYSLNSLNWVNKIN